MCAMNTPTSIYYQAKARHRLFTTLPVLLTLCSAFCTTHSLAQPEGVPGANPAQFRAAPQKPDEVDPTTLTALDEMEAALATKISLTVKDAAVRDIVQALDVAMPKPKKIEVRGADVISIALAFEEIELGNVLKATAALCGCNLYVLSDHFPIAKPYLVTQKERRYTESAANRRSSRLLALSQNLVRELQKLQVNAIELREISPKLQNIVQKMADLQAEVTYWQKIKLPGDTAIVLERGGDGNGKGNPNGFMVKFVLKSQQHTYHYFSIVP